MQNRKNRLTVKGKDKAPAKLTADEERMIEDCFYLPDWQFEVLFQPNCILIDEPYIGFTDCDGEEKRITVQIYGLKAFREGTKQDVCANFFLRNAELVYQGSYINHMFRVLEVIRKEFKRDEYEMGMAKKKQLAKAAA